jgi:molecular chaperone DnaK (HSP70)
VINRLFPDLPPDMAPKQAIRAVGIDLGTTNSVMAEATWDPQRGTFGQACCVNVPQETEAGEFLGEMVPSVVAIHQGQVFVGEGAKRLRALSSERGLQARRNLFYECKNDMGARITYHQAPDGFRNAAEVAGHVLRHLKSAAETEDAPVARTVVTVPASFQVGQRQDTLRAASLADIRVSSNELLDEPVAAFLDFMLDEGSKDLADLESPKNLVVFDFGGGTCDVAVFRVEMPPGDEQLTINPLAVSRYHRLGGGDIDAAVLHEVLVPMLCEQNGLSRYDLGYEAKKLVIEPAFLGLAESLKVNLCSELARLKNFEAYHRAAAEDVQVSVPGVYSCVLQDRGTLTLSAPTLTASQFEALLAPFVDTDLLHLNETEYRTTCSIFAPLQDALERADLESSDIDFVLLVGGSSLIPQVAEAVDRYFWRAQVLTYQDRLSMQLAIARGAAYHALCLAVFGRPLVRPVCHDTVALRTEQGLLELVPKGAPLPYPAHGGFTSAYKLGIPASSSGPPVEVKVEIVACEADTPRRLFSQLWKVPGPVTKGDPVEVEYRYDANQVLELRLRLGPADEDASFDAIIDHPFTNVVNPVTIRVKIAETEELLRTRQVPASQTGATVRQLAAWYAELGHYERALELLKKLLKGKSGAEASDLLNLMGIYAGNLGDLEREAKLYNQAATASRSSAPLFNVSLVYQKMGRVSDAIEAVERALALSREAPYLVRRATLARDVGDEGAYEAYLQEALDAFDPVAIQSDFELTYYVLALSLREDHVTLAKARAEQRRRRKSDEPDDLGSGQLPLQLMD